MVHPHSDTCFTWDRHSRLTCTFACRRDHHRPWRIRRAVEEGCGCLPGQPRWTISRHVGAGIYDPVAGADTFANAVTLLSRPLVVLDERCH